MVRTFGFSSRLSLSFPRSRGANLVFSSRPSCVKKCHPRPTPLFLAQGLLIANDSTASFPLPFLADNETFFTLPFSNNHPLSLN